MLVQDLGTQSGVIEQICQDGGSVSQSVSQSVPGQRQTHTVSWSNQEKEDSEKGKLQHSGPVTLYEDNQSTIKQASSLLSSDRSKHMDIKYRFIKQHVANGDICLEYIPTADQPADALTRSLDRIKANNRFNPPPFPLEAC